MNTRESLDGKRFGNIFLELCFGADFPVIAGSEYKVIPLANWELLVSMGVLSALVCHLFLLFF